MPAEALLQWLHEGRILACQLPAEETDHAAWVGIYPLSMVQPGARELLAREGLAILPGSSVRAYRIRLFELADSLLGPGGSTLAGRTWLQEGRATPLPTAISDAFDVHLAALPWAGTTALDWSRLAARQLNVVGKAPAEILHWVMTTRLGTHGHIAIWYSRDDGGVVVPLRAGIEALDEFYWGAHGVRFSFGVDLVDGRVSPFFDDLLQYGHGDLLVATA
jgi:hypothetical protein